MLTLLIVDDEAPARARLRRMAARVADCEVIGEASSGEQALEMITDIGPDAILLDISMPGLDGMGLARRLQEQDPSPAVIFCTAWPDQALEAFNRDAVDYLLKPVRQDRLESALDKARKLVGKDAAALEEQVFLRSTVGTRTELIPVSEVICLQAEDKYTTAFHSKGKTVINNPLVELEKEYPDRFLRIHRGALVSRTHIRGLERTTQGVVTLILDGCDHRPVASRRRLPEIRRIIRSLE